MLKQIIMMGGGKRQKNPEIPISGWKGSLLNSIIIPLLIFCVRVWMVQTSYNQIAPKLISNNGQSIQQFKELTFLETLNVVWLVDFLILDN